MNEKNPWNEFLDARYQAILWLEKNNNSYQEIAMSLSMDEEQIKAIKKSMAGMKKFDTKLCQHNDYLNGSQKDQFKNEFLSLMQLRDESNSLEKEYLESRNKFFEKWGK